MSDSPNQEARTAVTWMMPAAAAVDPRQTLPQQTAIVDEMNALMSGWMKRRQEALHTGLQALQTMATSRDPATAAKVCAEWMTGSLERIAADVRDVRDHSNRMAELGQQAMQTVLASQPAMTPGAEPAKTPAETMRAAA